MKKMLLAVVGLAFALSACETDKPKDVATKSAPAPVAQSAPVAQPAPAPAPAVEAPAPAAQAPAKIENVDWAKAMEMNKAGAVFVDVRTPGEVAEGMVEGALTIPLQEMDHRLAEFPKDKDLLIYCRSGRRSMAASDILVKNGYTRVFNVVGGFLAYPKN